MIRQIVREAKHEIVWLVTGFTWRAKISWKTWLGAAVALFVSVRLANLWIIPAIAGSWVFALILWCRLEPMSYARLVHDPLWRQRIRRRIRRVWPRVAEIAGLASSSPRKKGNNKAITPRLGRIRWQSGQVVLHPKMFLGQIVEDYRGQAERIRQAVGARSIRIVDERGKCAIWLSFRDVLDAPFHQEIPAVTTHPILSPIKVGTTDTNEPAFLRLGPATLVAGLSGSGKASLIWALMLGLAPAIKAGLVQVHGIDLKGGMELSMGEPMFARLARTPSDAVELLETAASSMQYRATCLSGVTRQHSPSTESPFILVLVDELAALTAYATDRETKRRAMDALGLLASQGRAVGYGLFASIQDPRKETVPMRGLFTQMVGLRLKDREETVMVLGDGAIPSGALCHQIPPSMPGLGYLVPADGGAPVRFRAGQVTDSMIKTVARAFPSPTRTSINAADADGPRSQERDSVTEATSHGR
jgi:S-DNA-T family DNA segregation ATPase FtsK/SpoIIIE